MAVLKCPVCGGELEVNSDLTVGVCKFCDSKIVIPKELDRKGNLYNRAVFLRQNNEFDKAVATYEDILKEDNSDAEAHWGLVLSKYGIEYVTDPRTNQHVPTYHRTQAQSILSDPDYLAALEYSDIEAQRVIEKEAKWISEIQTRILEISRKEPPYDIFICYKESDEFGNRTEDSTLAQELYYELVKKGYKVFFARKTLESKLGTEYEPIIYAALNSAKVMIVLGTKPDNFNAVWVRNEWIRFMRMGQENSFKTIIPAYRGMSPYELPTELSSLQSQDMSKIGFMQDLTDGIERCMQYKTGKATEKKEVTDSSYGVVPLDRLIQNSETYLKLKNFSAAEEVYTTVTKEYPEDYRGWWGLIVCKTQNFVDIILDQSTLNKWFCYVKQLATQKDYRELEEIYLEYTKKVAELAATEDMKAVNTKISSYNSQIGVVETQIKDVQNAITIESSCFKDTAENDDKDISDIQENLTRLQDEKESNIIWNLIFGCMFTFGVLILFSGGWGILWGIIIGGIGFVGWGLRSSDHLDNRSLEDAILKQNEVLADTEDKKAIHKQEHDKTVLEYNVQIDRLRNEITGIQAKIAECKSYLNLGKNKIVMYWYAEKCSAFEVQQSVDRQVVEYRKIAFGIKESDITNKQIEIILCPICGEKITTVEQEMTEQGFVVCKTCGSMVEVEQSSFVSEIHYEEIIDVICPACGSQITANQDNACEQGFITCSICGKEIEVENNYFETEMSLELMNEPSTDEKEDEEEYVDMTCPFCDAELSFMRWQIKEGNLRCYACDRTF